MDAKSGCETVIRAVWRKGDEGCVCVRGRKVY